MVGVCEVVARYAVGGHEGNAPLAWGSEVGLVRIRKCRCNIIGHVIYLQTLGLSPRLGWWRGEVSYKQHERHEHHSIELNPSTPTRTTSAFTMKLSTSLVLAAATTSTSAHTIFLSVNGGAVGDGVRVPTYDGVNLLLLQSPLFSI